MDISKLTKLSPVSKTLRFSLIPVGNTEKNVERDQILESDKKRADDYAVVKPVVDRYHKDYIERILSDFRFSDDELRYLEECYKGDDKDLLKAAQSALMDKISKAFVSTNEYKDCIVGTKNLFKKIDKSQDCLLTGFAENDEERNALDSFANFSLYFINYSQNRQNMYTGEGKSTEIAFRIIVQNFPKFVDNLSVWKRISATLPKETINILDSDMEGIVGFRSDSLFMVESFNQLMTQTGIERFNTYIGGYTCDDGTKIKGLNEYVNLFCQQTGEKLPKMKPLFKQILSDRESVSFIPDEYKNDNEVLSSIIESHEIITPVINGVKEQLSSLSSYELKGIFVRNDVSLTTLSNTVYGSWSMIKNGIALSYEHDYPKKAKQSAEKYEEEKEAWLKKKTSFSLFEIDSAVSALPSDAEKPSVTEQIGKECADLYDAIGQYYNDLSSLLSSEYPADKKLAKDSSSIEKIKNYLDALKTFQHFAEMFLGNGDEAEKDPLFYGDFEPECEVLDSINRLYDKIRNYVTKKPFSTSKFKLNFNRSDFLGGWAQPDEWGKQEAHLFEKENKYYIFVTSKTLKEKEWKVPLFDKESFVSASSIEYYFQKPDNKNTPRMFIRSKGTSYAPAVEEYKLPVEDIIELYDCGYFKTEYRKKNEKVYKESLTKLIDYFKLGFSKHESYSRFCFDWKASEEYDNIADFYRDTINSCYFIEKKTVNFNGLVKMVENGDGYLFEIYSKDFSQYSHGMPNLHTLYFKALFDTENKGHLRLSGGAEMFFRPKSLQLTETTVHSANTAIKNKNPLNPKTESTFEYNIIKDRRYTQNHYELHLPIELNYTADKKIFTVNGIVKESLYDGDSNYVIGIDRGERHLLYYSVIDPSGKIVEQSSLNVIENETDAGVKKQTDYHTLLDSKEKQRTESRKSWGTIESIKEIKEGYLSQAVHKICELVEKYNAIIVLENLNSGFKNTRSAVEKSVYQKFEKMLTDKLNYLVNKKKSAVEAGGYMNGYQLAAAKTSYSEMQGQNGILFYIPAWNTSKIDPTTGFVNLLNPKYETVEKSKDFFGRFTEIRYNEETAMFEFVFNYSNFPRAESDYIKTWTVCTNGERIWTHRDEKANGQFVSDTVDLSMLMSTLLSDYGIEYKNVDIKPAILRQTEKAFFVRLIHILKLTLQMRNSETGTEIDYLISPVKNKNGEFYDSRECSEYLPCDADANGAYNIARKGLWVIEKIKNCDSVEDFKIKSITNAEWLEYAQTHC